MAEILTLKTADLQESALKAKGTMLVDFWASWCGPCRMLSPVIDKVADEYDGRLTVGKLNIDDETEAAVSMGVSSIPTLVLFKDGVEQDRLVGAVPAHALREFIDKNI
ncbi:MAG: thioredoxin [Christensenellales bacterium]|jgi:thioredoxin 1